MRKQSCESEAHLSRPSGFSSNQGHVPPLIRFKKVVMVPWALKSHSPPALCSRHRGSVIWGPFLTHAYISAAFPRAGGLQQDSGASLSPGRRQGFPPPLLSELPPPPLHFAGTWGGELSASRSAMSTPASVLHICFLPSSPLLKVKGKIPTEEFKGHLRSLLYMVMVNSSNFQSPPLFMIPK